jgi:ribosome assembly protein SQT1
LLEGKRLLTGSADSSLILWDPKSTTPLLKFQPSDARFALEGGITALAANTAGTLALVGGAEGGLRIVNLASGGVVSTLEGHEEGSSVEGVEWVDGVGVGSGGVWVTAAADGKVAVWEGQNGSLRWKGEHEVRCSHS